MVTKRMINKLDISDSVKESADNLIGLCITDCDSELLELAIAKWLEQFVEDLPTDIDHFYQNNSTLSKLIFEAERQSEHLINLSQIIPDEDEINLDDYLDDEYAS